MNIPHTNQGLRKNMAIIHGPWKTHGEANTGKRQELRGLRKNTGERRVEGTMEVDRKGGGVES